MKPSDFYNEVKTYKFGLTDSVLCDLHKPCSTNRMCGNILSHPILNFDEVKEFYCQQNGLSSMSSSDGLTYSPSDKSLFFVEIKSWLNVINPPHGVPATEQQLENKAEKYAQAVKKKVNASFQICHDIASCAEKYEAIPKDIVLVTDIETQSNPLAILVVNLNNLGATALGKQQFCNEAMNKALAANNLNIHYWFCKEFDTNILKF